jgi:hypothetical protein
MEQRAAGYRTMSAKELRASDCGSGNFAQNWSAPLDLDSVKQL